MSGGCELLNPRTGPARPTGRPALVGRQRTAAVGRRVFMMSEFIRHSTPPLRVYHRLSYVGGSAPLHRRRGRPRRPHAHPNRGQSGSIPVILPARGRRGSDEPQPGRQAAAFPETAAGAAGRTNNSLSSTSCKYAGRSHLCMCSRQGPAERGGRRAVRLASRSDVTALRRGRSDRQSGTAR